jgi:hypothetical protein
LLDIQGATEACLKELVKQSIVDQHSRKMVQQPTVLQRKQTDELRYNMKFKVADQDTRPSGKSQQDLQHYPWSVHNRTMKAKIGEDPNWGTIDEQCDPIGI